MSITPEHWQSKSMQERLQARADAATFVLHQQFTRAHGTPKGELTTLVTTSVDGGVFLSRLERHQ